MDSLTILFITLAAILALGFAFFQYLFNNKNRRRDTYIFFGLRFFSVFILLLLLINPKITSTTYQLEKPNLILAVDNSQSITHLKHGDTVQEILNALKSNKVLQERFELLQYNFGSELKPAKNNDFKESETNIFSALESVKELSRNKKSAVVLISDGNQTSGRNFRYFKPTDNTGIYPVLVGDTTQYSDLELSRLNVNNYAFLNNRFPVEAFISYSGKDSITTKFVIKAGNNIVYSENFSLDSENNSIVIQAELPASKIGVLSYEAEIVPLKTEKNTANNFKSFGVEVIDERTEILLLSAIPHPDLGAIKKAVETNKQRQLDIKYLQDDLSNVQEYQLVILYQPTPEFATIFEKLANANLNYLVVTGTQTNWRFLNNIQDFISKDFTNQTQEIFAVNNPNFNQFQFEEVSVSDFPPLEDKFGRISVESNNLESIYFQKIENIETSRPLIAVQGSGQHKNAFIFGENIWRWRAASFLKHKSFERFDNFFGKLIQNLASAKQRERLRVDYKSFYYENELVTLSANFFDENYQFDPNANLNISVEDSINNFESQLILKNNAFQVDLGSLHPGTYNFKITEAGTRISRAGNFKIIAYNIEQKFVSANKNAMEALAQNSETQVYYQNQIQNLINSLITKDMYKPVQKTKQKNVPLIDWYYLLFLLVFILAAEWFFRKYKGLI